METAQLTSQFVVTMETTISVDVKQMLTAQLDFFVMVTTVASKTWDVTATAPNALAMMTRVTCLTMKTASGAMARNAL